MLQADAEGRWIRAIRDSGGVAHALGAAQIESGVGVVLDLRVKQGGGRALGQIVVDANGVLLGAAVAHALIVADRQVVGLEDDVAQRVVGEQTPAVAIVGRQCGVARRALIHRAQFEIGNVEAGDRAPDATVDFVVGRVDQRVVALIAQTQHQRTVGVVGGHAVAVAIITIRTSHAAGEGRAGTGDTVISSVSRHQRQATEVRGNINHGIVGAQVIGRGAGHGVRAQQVARVGKGVAEVVNLAAQRLDRGVVTAQQDGTEAALEADKGVASREGAAALVQEDGRFDLPDRGEAAAEVFGALEADAAVLGSKRKLAIFGTGVGIDARDGEVQYTIDVDVAGGRESGSGDGAGNSQSDQGFFHCFLLRK